jgi:hypothetical protein
MDMHCYLCYAFRSNFVIATNSKLTLQENPYYFWRTCRRTCFCQAIMAVMFIVFALLTATSDRMYTVTTAKVCCVSCDRLLC